MKTNEEIAKDLTLENFNTTDYETNPYYMGAIAGMKYSEQQTFEHMIRFAVWFSGMEQKKIINAYNRYIIEKQ